MDVTVSSTVHSLWSINAEFWTKENKSKQVPLKVGSGKKSFSIPVETTALDEAWGDAQE